jgi:mannose/fructose/N-acetylgalactosamine-specific phosphotransferase system component IIB
MATINLARIDDRLVHGQIMQVWSKANGTNTIYVVDDETANDDFMKEVYESSQSTGGLKIKVFSAEGLIKQYNKNKFGDRKIIIVFKNADYVKKVIQGGVPLTAIDVGNVCSKPNTTPISQTVYLSAKDYAELKDIAAMGVEVYFQNIPSGEKLSMDDVEKKIGK